MMPSGRGSQPVAVDGIIDPGGVFQSEPTVSYTPNGEDVRLLRVFRSLDAGFYVDVGAGHPSAGSVTRLFYDRGWSGINVEPGPAFRTLVAERPRDVNINAAVGETEEAVTFYVTYPDQSLSTLDLDTHRHARDAFERHERVEVPQRRLDSILREHATGRVIHFLKIDVEGAERGVIASSDWDEFRPIVVVVEAVESWSTAPTHERWEQLLVAADYEFAAFDGVNRFYVDAAHQDLAPILAYPLSALDRYRPVEVHEARAHADRLAVEIARLRTEVDRLRRDTSRLRDELAAVYASNTWRAGRVLARLGGPIARPVRRLRRAPRAEAASPAAIYRSAVREGAPWHFARTAKRSRPARTPLDRLVRDLGPFERPIDDRRAKRLLASIARVGWTDDTSLRERRLTWQERQALIELDAVLRASLSPPSSERRRTTGSPQIVVDARCLQDAGLRARGVGAHARFVLRAIREASQGMELALLLSAELPGLSQGDSMLGDRCIWAPLEDPIDAALYVALSPMTASAASATTYVSSPDCKTLALVYDFIPAQYPLAYLDSSAARLAYRARLEAVRGYDALLAISDSTARMCRTLLGPDAPVRVTGVADPLREATPHGQAVDAPFVLVPAGADARKNCAAAVAAGALLARRQAEPRQLVVTGFLTPSHADALHDLARRCGLSESTLQLAGEVEPDRLAHLYASADAVLVASHAEGFSLPVVEALGRSTPVVASDIPAHRELLGDGPWLAPSDDVTALADAAAFVLLDRDAVLERQRAAVGRKGDPEAVRETVIGSVRGLLSGRRARPGSVTRRGRPRIAVISPFPPQHSGVADYTAFTFAEVARDADVDVYTAAAAKVPDRVAVRPLSSAPYLDPSYDAIVNVVGNSHFHFPVLDFLGAFGGACIAHDVSMIEAYGWDRGPGAPHAAASGSGYGVISKQASPLIVHARSLASAIEQETGVSPVVVPFVPYNLPNRERLDKASQAAARAALGIDDAQLHLAVFGFVDCRTKGHDLAVGALAWLRHWRIPVVLHIVGEAPEGERRTLETLAAELEVTSELILHGRLPRGELDLFLEAVDAAIQIRTNAVMTLSGGLTDCVAYGVPTVATRASAEELDTPSYVATVEAQTSSLLLAEAVETVLGRRREQPDALDSERRAYLERRSARSYAKGLLEALGLDPTA